MKRSVMVLAAVVLFTTVLSVNGATVAYWQFDETDGTSFVDAVGSFDLLNIRSEATQECPAINPISNPDAGPFSVGTPQENPAATWYASGVVDPNLDPGLEIFGMGDTPWTFEGYIKTNTVTHPQNAGWIIGSRHRENGWNEGFAFAMTNGGRLDVTVVNFAQQAFYINTGDFDIVAGQWYHVAVTWDPSYVDPTWGNVGQVTIYVDHVMQGQGLGDGDLGYSPGSYLGIGGRDSTDDGVNEINYNMWLGEMDELRWSNTILSPSEFLPVPDPLVRASEKDFNCDEVVNIADFAEFVSDWLLETPE